MFNFLGVVTSTGAVAFGIAEARGRALAYDAAVADVHTWLENPA